MANIQELFRDISKLSHLYLYDDTNYSDIVYSFSLDPDYKNKLMICGEQFIDDDWNTLEEYGNTKEMFQTIYDKCEKLLKLIAVPYNNDNSSYKKLYSIYYKNKITDIEKYVNDFNQIYEDCTCSTKNDSYLIERDLRGFDREEDIFVAANPYKLIPNATKKLKLMIQDIEKNIENINTSSFIFSDNFKILDTFYDEIQDKGLNNEEIAAVEKEFSSLIMKGFILWQIRVKMSAREIETLRNSDLYHFSIQRKIGNTDDDVQKYSEFMNLAQYIEINGLACDVVDVDKLNQIYQNHMNDEVGQVFKPLIEELIPYYKSIDTSEGMIKIMHDFSEYYQPLFPSKFTTKDIYPLYLKIVPFKLNEVPRESYNNLFFILIRKLFLSIFYEYDYILEFPEIPEKLEEIDHIESLQQQKYYIIRYIINILPKQLRLILPLQDICLILSLFSWEIDVNSQESRDFKNYIDCTISDVLKTYDYNSYQSVEYFANYIINTVNVAHEPLITNEMKDKLDQLKDDAFHHKKVEQNDDSGGCCIIY